MGLNTPPEKYPDKETRNLFARVEAAERRRQERLMLSTTYLPDGQSLGERLVPYLYAAMEACWIDAVIIGLAGFGLFGTYETLMPLWAPFVILAGAFWLAKYLEMRDVRNTPPLDEFDQVSTNLPGMPLFVTLLGVLMLFCVWMSIYASTIPLYNPMWLLAAVNDILLLNPHFYQMLAIFAGCAYFAWRGIKLTRQNYEPSTVFNAFRIGLIVIIAMVILRTAQQSSGSRGHAEVGLLLLIPLFLFLAISAHALAQAHFVRHSHATGLEGSTAAQERAIFTVIGVMGLILLILSLSVGSFVSPAVLADMQSLFAPIADAYRWLTGVVAEIIVLLVTPFFWLLTALHLKPQLPRIPNLQPPAKPGSARTVPSGQGEVLASILGIVVPMLFVAGMIVLIIWALRRRRVRIVAKRTDIETHESLWSWSLFWTQVKAFLLSLLASIFPRKKVETPEEHAEESNHEPMARSIREIYRAFLRLSSSRGYLRRRVETPYEFRQRLSEHVPLIEPQLGSITEAYTAVRYGGDVPDEAEVARIRSVYTELQHRWSET